MDEFLKQIPGWQAYLIALVLVFLWVREKWFKVKSDGIATKKSTLDYQSDQIEELKKLIEIKDQEAKTASESNRQRSESLGRELSTLQGQYLESQKQAKTYLDILQNRDPKMEQLIGQVAKALTDIHEFMQKHVTPISAIK